MDWAFYMRYVIFIYGVLPGEYDEKLCNNMYVSLFVVWFHFYNSIVVTVSVKIKDSINLFDTLLER